VYLELRNVVDEDEANSSLKEAFAEGLERSDSEALIALTSDLPVASTETRKAGVQELKTAVADDSTTVGPVLPVCKTLLEDDERSVRLTTAKLFVAVAKAEPDAVVSCVPALTSRLADEEEFYYVRARAAEALGYVALDHPDAVTTPEMLADLRIGLSFEDSEVREKLAKALEFVAVGNPGRLRQQVSTLAEHLDDENVLVRYHLCTALAAVGCEYPAALAEVTDTLTERLDDENIYVRGRAVEAFGLLARSGAEDASLVEGKRTRRLTGSAPSRQFVG
jgi:HEAT repeat protein